MVPSSLYVWDETADAFVPWESTGGAAHVLDTGLPGTWNSAEYSGASEVTNSFASKSVPANVIAVTIKLADLGSSVVDLVAISIGDYTTVQSEAQCDALIAGTASTAFPLSVGETLEIAFDASASTTLIGWKGKTAETGNNRLTLSWKVAS